MLSVCFVTRFQWMQQVQCSCTYLRVSSVSWAKLKQPEGYTHALLSIRKMMTGMVHSKMHRIQLAE